MTWGQETDLPAILIINGQEINVKVKSISEKEDVTDYDIPDFYEFDGRTVIGRRETEKTFCIECGNKEIEQIFYRPEMADYFRHKRGYN